MIIGLSREKLETRLKAAKLRAVAQFATARNNEIHDRQWGLPQAPNPNKEVRVVYNIGKHSAYLIGKITFPSLQTLVHFHSIQPLFNVDASLIVTLSVDPQCP